MSIPFTILLVGINGLLVPKQSEIMSIWAREKTLRGLKLNSHIPFIPVLSMSFRFENKFKLRKNSLVSFIRVKFAQSLHILINSGLYHELALSLPVIRKFDLKKERGSSERSCWLSEDMLSK